MSEEFPLRFDTHCHLDRYPDPLAEAQRLEADRVAVLAMTNLPSHFRTAQPHLKPFRRVRPALGFHPLAVHEAAEEEVSIFADALPETSYVGEIGLDFSRLGKETKNAQLCIFRRLLRLIADEQPHRRRLLSLHSRGAERAILEELSGHSVEGAVFHWFTGSQSMLDRVVEAGHLFSINPQMLETSSGRDRIKRIPSARVLTETDAPYTKYARKAVRPGHVEPVLVYLAEVWGVSVSTVSKTIAANFAALVTPNSAQVA